MPPALPGRTRAVRTFAIAGIALYGAGVCLAEHHLLGAAIRVAGVALLAFAAVNRRTITAWTFFAILAGTELGVDAPAIAVHLHVLAEIFLRLVRVIVAPLILGTLTTGIAAHGRLRSLGRVAVKTLLYFEIITTLALLLGVVAIDISRAGEGVVVPTAVAAQQLQSAVPQHTGFESFLLSVFPENLVTAIAENQILQVAVFSILFGIALALLTEEKR